MRKIKRIAKFEGLEPRRCEDIKGIVVPDIGPKSFGTFEKQAPGLSWLKGVYRYLLDKSLCNREVLSKLIVLSSG